MSSQKESTVRTLTVALLVCLVCSIFVAGAAVALRPTQQENRLLDKQRSILAIAGLGEAGMSANKVKQLFNERIVARLVDLETGKFSDEFDAKTFDPLVAAKDPALSRPCQVSSRTSPRSSVVSVTALSISSKARAKARSIR